MSINLHPDRLFSPDPAVRRHARRLHEQAAALPIVSPHGHVDPALFTDPHKSFGNPAQLFISPDHYITRMLFSQGIPLASLLQDEPRVVWRTFCSQFHLFRATPSGTWLSDELSTIFGINEVPAAGNADSLYDQLQEKLSDSRYSPRALYERFNIALLATTDAATDTLVQHRKIRDSGWQARIVPTFRPDAVVNLDAPGWAQHIQAMREVTGIEINSYPSFITALEQQRSAFRQMGALATDHAAITAATGELSPAQAEAHFQRALKDDLQPGDAARFTAHMLMEMARMSVEDGLVMQLHPGSLRNHNDAVYQDFGPDRGADIPVQVEFTRSLQPLLNRYGTDPRLSLIVFSLDESTYSRELAPLAGFYPALRLGPPWWFLDSFNGMMRYFDQVMETAGLYNTAGFNDDTRAFCSIPARHDVWRRASANWLAGLLVRHVISKQDAEEMMHALSCGLACRAYRLHQEDDTAC